MLRLLVFHPLDAGLQGDQLLLDVADPFLGLVLDLGMVGVRPGCFVVFAFGIQTLG